MDEWIKDKDINRLDFIKCDELPDKWKLYVPWKFNTLPYEYGMIEIDSKGEDLLCHFPKIHLNK